MTLEESSPQARKPPSSRSRKPIRVAVLHNVDYEDFAPGEDPGYVARADVGHVANDIAEILKDGAHEVHVVPVGADLAALRARLVELDPDCAFNLCESLVGDARLECAVPLILELMGIPCTGSPPEALSHALYKDRVKRRLEAAGVPTPRARVMTGPDSPCDLPFPIILKPVHEDGSVGITQRSLVGNDHELRERVAELVATFKQPCLAEQYIDGRELNVALFGFPAARVLPLSEIDFTKLPAGLAPIVSYDAKWTEGTPDWNGCNPVTHPQLPNTVAARVRRVAVETFRAIGMRDYGRVDVRLAASGVPYVIDVNPNCDLSWHAGMARSAAAVGIDYPSMVKLLVRYALRRRRAASEQLFGRGPRREIRAQLTLPLRARWARSK